jgi:Cu-processing system permease protein
MIGRIWAIALNTYREAVRQKILYTLVFFCIVLILFSFLLGQLSLGADTKVIKDMGLASVMVFGSLISIFMGIGLVFKEIERRTIYTILSKPVSRTEFIVGKFVGLCSTVAVEVAAMTALLFVVLSFYREPLDFNLIKAVVLIYMELCILIAVSLLFSSYSSAFMSALFCISFLVVGHVTDDFVGIFGKGLMKSIKEGEIGPWAGSVLTHFMSLFQLLSLDHLVINAKVVHGVFIPWGWVLSGVVYGVSWIFFLLCVAVILFRRKDLV